MEQPEIVEPLDHLLELHRYVHVDVLVEAWLAWQEPRQRGPVVHSGIVWGGLKLLLSPGQLRGLPLQLILRPQLSSRRSAVSAAGRSVAGASDVAKRWPPKPPTPAARAADLELIASGSAPSLAVLQEEDSGESKDAKPAIGNPPPGPNLGRQQVIPVPRTKLVIPRYANFSMEHMRNLAKDPAGSKTSVNLHKVLSTPTLNWGNKE